MEQKRLCPYCMGELPPAADSCVHCGKVFAGRNPAGCLPVGTVLAGRYTVGEMRSLDGEGILYRGVENLGCFRVTIKEYLPAFLRLAGVARVARIFLRLEKRHAVRYPDQPFA